MLTVMRRGDTDGVSKRGIDGNNEHRRHSGNSRYADSQDAESRAHARVRYRASCRTDLEGCFQSQSRLFAHGPEPPGARRMAGRRVAADGQLAAGEILQPDAHRQETT